MNSKLLGQTPLLNSITQPLELAAQLDASWTKRKTWVCLLSSSKRLNRPSPSSSKCLNRPSRSCTALHSPFRTYRKLVNQSQLRQVQEQAIHQGAIALQSDSANPASLPSSTVDASTQVNQLKDTFLSTISHELRTPISSIKMAVQMLTLALSREGLLAPAGKGSLNGNKIAHYLKILNDECNREINLITDLLDMQQLEAAAPQPLNLQPIALESYLRRIVRPFQEQGQTQQKTLTVDLPSDLPVVRSDVQSLERILVELLTNALKYTPEYGRINVGLQINRSDLSGSPIVVFEVCNSGVELSPEQQTRIFEKFYRIPSSDPHKHGGTGLGLALVKKLVTHLGGTIKVHSAAQRTCFSVELPLNSEVRLPSLASV